MSNQEKIFSGSSGNTVSLQSKDGQSKAKSRFSLTKYYVDLVTTEGLYFIGYSAQLQFGSLKLNYSATLHHPAMTGIDTGPVFYFSGTPVVNNSELSWSSKRLGFNGLWKPISKPIQHTLLETSDGLVDWECLQPAAQVELQTRSGKRYEGLGYSEFLSMTITPWRLGLKTLYWGRFVTDTHAIVWIEWQGEHPRTLLICNGQKMEGADISNTSVKCDAFELILEREAIIRQGSLGNTVLSKVPSILKVAPIEFLGVREEKFLSRGQFISTDGAQCKGWAIHEKIIWP